jgi:hypothetical protein
MNEKKWGRKIMNGNNKPRNRKWNRKKGKTSKTRNPETKMKIKENKTRRT